MPPGDLDDRVHVGRRALQMADDDRLGARRDPRFDVLGIDRERLVNFGEDRQPAAEDDRVVVGVPSPSGQNDLVARADLQRRQRRKQGRRARGNRQGVFDPDMLGIGPLELQHLGLCGRRQRKGSLDSSTSSRCCFSTSS